MTIVHSKVSGQTNIDPAKVGGEDWDAEHALGNFAMLPVSVAAINWDYGTTTVGAVTRSPSTGTTSRTSAGVYTYSFTDGDPVIADGYIKEYTAIHAVSPYGSWPTGWRSEVSVSSGGVVTLSVFDNTDTPADPTLSVDFTVTVYLSVKSDR